MDLQNAVNRALERELDEELQFHISQSEASNHDSDEDEVVGFNTERANAPTQNPSPRHHATNLSSQFSAIEDDDSIRSFRLESDYYGQATILSTPGATPVPETRAVTSRLRRQVLDNVPDDAIPQDSPQKGPQPRSSSQTQPVRRVTRTQPKPPLPEPQPPSVTGKGKGKGKGRVEEEEEDEDGSVRNANWRQRSQTDTPSPNPRSQAKLPRRGGKREPAPQESEDEQDLERERPRIRRPSLPRALGAPTLRPPGTSNTVPAPSKQRQPELRSTMIQLQGEDSSAPLKTLRHIQEPSQDSPQEHDEVPQQQKSQPSHQNQTLTFNRERPQGVLQQRSEPVRRKSRDLFPAETSSNGSTSSKGMRKSPDEARVRDAEIQRNFQETEEQPEPERGQRRASRRRGRHERIESRRRRWTWMLSWWPFTQFPDFIRRQREREDGLWDVEDWEDGRHRIRYSDLFYPLTYVNLFVRVTDEIFERAIDFNDKLAGLEMRQRMSGVGTCGWVLGGLLTCILGMAIALFLSTSTGEGIWESSPSIPTFGIPTGGINWPDLSDITDFVPSISWPSRGLDDLSDLWDTDDNDNGEQKAKQILKRFEKDLAKLKKAGGLHNASLQKLETVVPKVVRMELQDGKPVVTQEFWHALRDLINKDDQFLRVEKTVDGYEFTSDEQWQALVRRLNKDPAFAEKLDSGVDRLGDRLEKKMLGNWDIWVNNNNHKISQLLGTALDKMQLVGSGKELDKRLAEIVKEQMRGKDSDETIVTRNEFLRHLQNEFATHGSEVRGELNQLESQIESLREAIRLAAKNKSQGVTQGEVGALVQSLVRKTIADMNLGSMAKGKIQLHWDAELKNQVNYFAIGSGATIDPKRTSTVYDPLNMGAVAPENYLGGIRGLQPFPAIAALHPWDGDGDCFCAIRSTNRRGNPHGASLSVQLGTTIVPQHVVVEHILPGATIDPGARPREIEIWAHYDDLSLRGRVQDFSATHFPKDKSDRNAQDPDYDPAFVKIGQFVYEHAEIHDGVHVQRLSSELHELGAATDQIIIRAVSNYGSSDHTCFYRVRLYGPGRE